MRQPAIRTLGNSLPNQTSTQFFKITSGPGGSACPGANSPFNPGFRAAGGTTAPALTAALDLHHPPRRRPDPEHDRHPHPAGLLGDAKRHPVLPDATLNAIASSSYSGVSELNNPSARPQARSAFPRRSRSRLKALQRPGRVYLAGPTKALRSASAVITPAFSGPYDLATSSTGGGSSRSGKRGGNATSDPLPQIIDGIPLRLRSVLINLDRKDFTLNPTNCDPF